MKFNINITTPANQAAVFFMILGVNIIVFSLFITLSAEMLFENLYTADPLLYINALTQIGVFGLTTFECSLLFWNKRSMNYLQINKGISVWECFFLICIAVISLPALSHIITWNEGIKFPQFMSSIEAWMRGKEDAAVKTTTLLLAGKSVQVLFINLLVIAIIPSVCEEFLFRGFLITWFKKQISNIHVVVFISACAFSAIHLQFYGFVPRLLMGLYLGYLFVWTGSIWACIFAHFINNSMTVIISYLFNNQIIDTEYQNFGNVGNNYLLIGMSVVLTTVCIYFLYRKRIYKVEKSVKASIF